MMPTTTLCAGNHHLLRESPRARRGISTPRGRKIIAANPPRTACATSTLSGPDEALDSPLAFDVPALPPLPLDELAEADDPEAEAEPPDVELPLNEASKARVIVPAESCCLKLADSDEDPGLEDETAQMISVALSAESLAPDCDGRVKVISVEVELANVCVVLSDATRDGEDWTEVSGCVLGAIVPHSTKET